MSGTGDHVVVVGAASKGIIQRDFQHHAMVYRSLALHRLLSMMIISQNIANNDRLRT